MNLETIREWRTTILGILLLILSGISYLQPTGRIFDALIGIIGATAALILIFKAVWQKNG